MSGDSNVEVLGPDMLRAITPSLEKCGQLKKLSLFGNGRAGNHSRALHDFLAAVGRRCVVSFFPSLAHMHCNCVNDGMRPDTGLDQRRPSRHGRTLD